MVRTTHALLATIHYITQPGPEPSPYLNPNLSDPLHEVRILLNNGITPVTDDVKIKRYIAEYKA